ncbi:MAG: hypothetical protein UT84_C0020G0013 [Candidatus Curtissbacteria bacterium GW2011_GWA1_40_16]|uniref:Uncharacterized protein n=1 Tax=Candidatus Curtissbacteria bacterium GW2011_GWA1_40_16 TaxID=1618405 RepID=A0A0G0RAM2_9BACT|nr:MAG: hypothetical protein UT84_C0020G0013 [Candidatus Curtissbacteria bacterium GW2011_GWA1_40_16]
MQVLGIFIGLISGLVWEMLSTSPFNNFPTLIPSLIVKTSTKNMHLHHWPIYLIALIILGVWSYKTTRITHPAILMIMSALFTAIVYNIFKSPDWYKFLE